LPWISRISRYRVGLVTEGQVFEAAYSRGLHVRLDFLATFLATPAAAPQCREEVVVAFEVHGASEVAGSAGKRFIDRDEAQLGIEVLECSDRPTARPPPMKPGPSARPPVSATVRR
jgi:hypothetical protein